MWTLSSKTQSAKDFINLIKIVIQTNKHKMILAGNRYTGIKSNEFSNFLDKNNITFMFINVNSPQSNGLCERVNQTVVTRLRCKLNNNNHNVWPKLLEKVTEEYNNTPHNVTQFTPEFLMFGNQPFEPLINGLNMSLDEARKIAFNNSEHNHEFKKIYYVKNHMKVSLKEGVCLCKK